MHDYSYDDEPDGFCQECNLDLDEDPGGDHDENHRLCWECWRAENEPEPVTEPTPIRPHVADQRFERLLERVRDLELRVARIERAA